MFDGPSWQHLEIRVTSTYGTQMPFHVFHADTGEDVSTFPEQVLGRRWCESSFLQKIPHVLLVISLSVAGVGVFLVFSLM